jgi:hypothetical protein
MWSGKPGIEKPRNVPGRRQVAGDGMIGRFDNKTQGDLGGNKAGVHATRAEEPIAQESEHPIVAKKPGNAGGAKGGRKVETL